MLASLKKKLEKSGIRGVMWGITVVPKLLATHTAMLPHKDLSSFTKMVAKTS